MYAWRTASGTASAAQQQLSSVGEDATGLCTSVLGGVMESDALHRSVFVFDSNMKGWVRVWSKGHEW